VKDKVLDKHGVEFTAMDKDRKSDSMVSDSSLNEDTQADDRAAREEERMDNDPLNSLGFGFTAYFKMMNVLTIVFFIMTVLALP